MPVDAHTNFAYSTVATAPSPATTGTTLTLNAGDGALFPAVPFNLTVWPAGQPALANNSEIVRVTARTTDTLTFSRQTEAGGINRSITIGDQVAATITAKTLTDAEAISAPAYAATEFPLWNGSAWVRSSAATAAATYGICIPIFAGPPATVTDTLVPATARSDGSLAVMNYNAGRNIAVRVQGKWVHLRWGVSPLDSGAVFDNATDDAGPLQQMFNEYGMLNRYNEPHLLPVGYAQVGSTIVPNDGSVIKGGGWNARTYLRLRDGVDVPVIGPGAQAQPHGIWENFRIETVNQFGHGTGYALLDLYKYAQSTFNNLAVFSAPDMGMRVGGVSGAGGNLFNWTYVVCGLGDGIYTTSGGSTWLMTMPQGNQGCGFQLDNRSPQGSSTPTTFISPAFETNRQHAMLIRGGHSVQLFGGYVSTSGGPWAMTANIATAIGAGATQVTLTQALTTPTWKAGDHITIPGCISSGTANDFQVTAVSINGMTLTFTPAVASGTSTGTVNRVGAGQNYGGVLLDENSSGNLIAGTWFVSSKLIDVGWDNLRILCDGDPFPRNFVEPIENYFPSSLVNDPDETFASSNWTTFGGASQSKGTPNPTTQYRGRRRRGRLASAITTSSAYDTAGAYKYFNCTPGETYMVEVYLACSSAMQFRIRLLNADAPQSVLFQSPVYNGWAFNDESEQRVSFVWYNPAGSGVTQVRVAAYPIASSGTARVDVSYVNPIRQACPNGAFSGLYTGGIADQWSADATNTGGTASQSSGPVAAQFAAGQIHSGDVGGYAIPTGTCTGSISAAGTALTLSAAYILIPGTTIKIAGAGSGGDLVTTIVSGSGTSYVTADAAITGVASAALTIYPSSAQRISVGNNQKYQLKLTTGPTYDINALYLWRAFAYVESGDPNQVVAGVGTDLSGTVNQMLGRAVMSGGWFPLDSYVFRPIGSTWVPRIGILPGIATVAYFDDCVLIPLKQSTASKMGITGPLDVSSGNLATTTPTVVATEWIDRRVRRVRIIAATAIVVGGTAPIVYVGTAASATKYVSYTLGAMSQGQEIDITPTTTDFRAGSPIIVQGGGAGAGNTGKINVAVEYD